MLNVVWLVMNDYFHPGTKFNTLLKIINSKTARKETRKYSNLLMTKTIKHLYLRGSLMQYLRQVSTP